MRIGSYLRIEGDGKVTEEADCYTCAHCRKPIPKATYPVAGSFCIKCGSPVCMEHPDHDVLGPAAKRIDEALERRAMWRRAGIR